MLDAYRKLQANGAIGPMMKIGNDGQPLWDPSGELPGQIVTRPYQEYPKVVKRWKDADGNSKELIAHSKAEELKIISERIEEFSGDQRGPVERERDALAQDLSDQVRINQELELRLNALMAQVEQLAKVQEAAHAPVAPHGGLASATHAAVPGVPAKPSPALSAEKKAVLNQK